VEQGCLYYPKCRVDVGLCGRVEVFARYVQDRSPRDHLESEYWCGRPPGSAELTSRATTVRNWEQQTYKHYNALLGIDHSRRRRGRDASAEHLRTGGHHAAGRQVEAISRSDRPSTLRKAKKIVAFPRKRLSVALGPPSTSRTTAGRRADQVLDALKIPLRRAKADVPETELPRTDHRLKGPSLRKRPPLRPGLEGAEKRRRISCASAVPRATRLMGTVHSSSRFIVMVAVSSAPQLSMELNYEIDNGRECDHHEPGRSCISARDASDRSPALAAGPSRTGSTGSWQRIPVVGGSSRYSCESWQCPDYELGPGAERHGHRLV